MLESFAGMRMAPPMIAGSNKVSTRNERCRTRSRYSRLMTSQVLMSAVLGMGFSHGLEENLFQRRLHQFELGEADVCSGAPQQLLRICSRGQVHFDIVSVVVERLHQLGIVQKLRIAVVLHLHVPHAVSGADFGQIALQHGAPVIDEANGIAQALGGVHAMRGKQKRLSRFLQIQKCVFEHDGAGGVETGGSSMTTNCGSCTTAPMNCTFCCMPLESSST